MYPTNTAAPLKQCNGSRRCALPNPDVFAAALIEAARDALDALGGGIERVGNRALHLLGALARGDAHVLQSREFLLESAQAFRRFGKLITERQRRHHDEPHVADGAEASLELLDALVEIVGEPHKVIFLPVLAGHAVLPAVDRHADVAHCRASRTERMFSTAVSRRCAISRLAASSLRARAVAVSRSEASLERSVPSACTWAASAFSPRSVSRRCSSAPSRASRAAESRLVAASIALASVIASPRAGKPPRPPVRPEIPETPTICTRNLRCAPPSRQRSPSMRAKQCRGFVADSAARW